MRAVVVSFLFLAFVFVNAVPALDANLVRKINAMNTTWTASMNQGAFFDGLALEKARGLFGVLKGGPKLQRKIFPSDEVTALPESFDSAVNWPSCKSINTIRDQSVCGSCWAFGAVEAMTDRYCVMLGAQFANIEVSSGDLLSCCDSCGMGCNGGYPSAAWDYWVSTGLASEGCDPYPFPKCEHHVPAAKYPACPADIAPTPRCNKTCVDETPKKLTLKGKSSYSVSGESDLMSEIYKNGPVEVAFTVYADFPTYKSGVYKHISGSQLGGHAVKMTGWGVQNGVKYWIINNSWNEDWGNKGQFLILRGSNECGIEDEGVGGVPAAPAAF